jgi:GntR family transcriptional regulator, transcriptional repressor for pyruvate dehydrogenase complex
MRGQALSMPDDFPKKFDLRCFDPIFIPHAREIVADTLRRKIELGAYPPGERLLSERELAKNMRVSRVTVREALAILRDEGLINIQPSKRGALVRRPPRQSDEEIREELTQKRDQLLSIFDLRIVVEPHAASLAAQHCTSEHLNILDKSVTNMKRAAATLQEATIAITDATFPAEKEVQNQSEDAAMVHRRQDYTFHLAIATATGNPYLLETIERLRTEFFTPTDVLYRLCGGNPRDAAGEHEAILSAIRDKEEKKAAKEMREHLLSTKNTLLLLLEA